MKRFLVLVLASVAFAGQAANFVVTNTLSSGPGSLSDALEAARTNAAGADEITFAIPGAPPFIIAATSTLPKLTGRTTVDATTQAGYSSNAPAVILDGSAIVGSGTNGLWAEGSENIIRGLQVQRFSGQGIYVTQFGLAGQSNRVEACHLLFNGDNGVLFQAVSNSVVGGLAASNRNVAYGNGQAGIALSAANVCLVAGNWVGVSATNSASVMTGQVYGINLVNCLGSVVGSSSEVRQVIGGCSSYALRLYLGGSNVVQGNAVGCDATLSVSVSNKSTGLLIGSSDGNRIGGTAAYQRNWLSGNLYGLEIYGCSSNVVEGNFIGTDASGLARLPNRSTGIRIGVDASYNQVGGFVAGARNIVSGNAQDGVMIVGSENSFIGNYVGLGSDGSTVVSNRDVGVRVLGTNNEVALNVIAANGQAGVVLDGAANGCLVQGNRIGNDAFDARKPNLSGVEVWGARNCVIGGQGAGNLISGNHQYGVKFATNVSTGCRVEGNYIGLAADGVTILSNNFQGIRADGGVSNFIGGLEAGMGNIIAGNGAENVWLNSQTRAWTVAGNRIGVVLDGLTTYPTDFGYSGLLVHGSDHVIGGTTSTARNVISGASQTGLYIYYATNTTVQGNWIGLGGDGATYIGNGTNDNAHGIRISLGSTRTRVGGAEAGAGNVIVGYPAALEIDQSPSNTVQGNFIGLTAAGTSMVVQTAYGVEINPGTWNLIGGTAPGAGNVIYGSASAISVQTTNSHHNTIQGNIINLDRFGNIAITNTGNGITIGQAQSNLIGGATAGARNVIATDNSIAIEFYESNTVGNVAQGNYIGVGPDGVSSRKLGFSGGFGFYLLHARNNTIGGTNVGEGNIIAHRGTGIHMTGDSVRNAIFGNTIYSNNLITVGGTNIHVGIDLVPYLALPDGTTPNDNVPDADLGPNEFQNFPVLTNAVSMPGSTRIQGRLASKPSAKYRIEFFYSDTTNSEGRVYLGATNITTAASGTNQFDVTLNGYAPTSKWLTATATDTNNNTSEFCPGLIKPGPANDTDGDGIPDYWESAYGLNPNLASDATNHLDADGVNNLNEYLSGTIPNNAASYLRITTFAPTDGTTNLISFPTSQYRNYNLEAAFTATNNALWTTLRSNVLGSGLTITLGDTATTNAEYYRVRSVFP